MTKKERIEALQNFIDGILWSMENSRKFADAQEDWTIAHRMNHVNRMTGRYMAQASGAIQFATIYEGLNLTQQETDDLYRIIYNVHENCNDWSKEFEAYGE